MGPTSSANALGYSGLIPFVVLGAGTCLLGGALQQQVAFALLAYGAVILSFLGAIHWGLAVRDPIRPSVKLLVWGVLPSLMAWAALLWGLPGGLWLLAAGLWLCWAVDRAVYPSFALAGWLTMRLVLTSLASLSCAAGALALSR